MKQNVGETEAARGRKSEGSSQKLELKQKESKKGKERRQRADQSWQRENEMTEEKVKQHFVA